MRWVAIAAGGALGAVLRYLLSGWVQAVTGPRFPWGTLVVNALGSLLLGLFMASALAHAGGDAWGRHFWAVGLIGAFTTYSTFSYETVALLEVGDLWAAAGNVVLNLALGLGAVVIGLRLGEAW
jgi:CrcB protein